MAITSRSRIDAIDEAAIDWLVELRSGENTADCRRSFDAWLAADEKHRRAWQRLGCAVDSTFGDAPRRPDLAGKVICATLQNAATLATQRRRMLRGALGIAGVSLGAIWAANNAGLMPDVMATLRTTTGERRSFQLADGSVLLLDARSSADVDFSDRQRFAELRTGQLIATVSPSNEAPFVVRSDHGSVRALGDQLLVRHEPSRTLALALGDGIEIALPQSKRPHETRVLRQGEAAWFDGERIDVLATNSYAVSAAAWARGMLEALDMPLGEVVAALRPYRRGLVSISREIADIRVTGAYPLDDTDAALAALADTLPINVRIFAGGWIVGITPHA